MTINYFTRPSQKNKKITYNTQCAIIVDFTEFSRDTMTGKYLLLFFFFIARALVPLKLNSISVPLKCTFRYDFPRKIRLVVSVTRRGDFTGFLLVKKKKKNVSALAVKACNT